MKSTENKTPVALGDLIDIKHGWPFKSEDFVQPTGKRPIVVSIGNFRYTGGFRFESTTVKEYKGEYPKEFELSPGDVLIIMTCQTAGGEILGVPGRVPNDGRIYLHNQRIGKVVIKAPNAISLDYLYWLFLWQEFNRSLVSTATGTKILHTAPSRISEFRFHLPTMAEQRAIAHILGTLDEKIELCRQMNQTLEEMARSLFRSWFVDFDPVRAKAEGSLPSGMDAETAKLFPSEFEQSEMGEIPKGWQIQRFEESFKIPLRNGLTRPKAVRGHGTRMVNMGELFSNRRIGNIEMDRVPLSDEERQKNLLGVGDILFARQSLTLEGAGQCSIVTATDEPLTFESHLIRCRLDESRANPWFFFYYFLSPVGQSRIKSIVEQVAASGIRGSDLARLQTVVPPPELQQKFGGNVQTWEEQIAANSQSSDTLAQIRDELLPPLLSGQLAIRDAERFLERNS